MISNIRIVFAAGLLSLAACSESAPAGNASAGSAPAGSALSEASKSALPETYHLAAEPADAKDILALKQDLKDGDAVVVRGRVQDFVNGLAAFVMTDGSLRPCNEEGPMPDCETPWDYCCTDPAEVSAASAGVEFHDGSSIRRVDAAGFHGLDRLKWVTVKGVAKVDPKGNVTVVADGLFVKP
ncbi:MAG: hypothetical protein L6Q99_16170 [Planctomycetes bacterium]|nr:hypothetical protein [Planctomycetota bacterium]